MKKNLWLVSAGLLLVSVSCSNDEEKNVIDGETVVSNDADAIALATGALSDWARFSSGYSFTVESVSSGSVSFEGEEDADGPKISRLDITSPYDNAYLTGSYSRNALAISSANNAIEKIQTASGVSAATRKLAVGRALIARALGYSVLVKLYGEVPLTLTTASLSKERASIDEVYTQIVKDLEAAADSLPESETLPSNPTKGTAWALLSRVYLDWGNNPLTQSELSAIYSQKTDPAVSYNNDRLEKAVYYADKVIDSGRYELETNFGDIWGKDNEASGREKILTFVRDGDAAGSGNHQTHCSWTFAFNNTVDNHFGASSDEPYTNWPYGEEDSRRDWTYIATLTNPETDTLGWFLPPVTLPRYAKYVDRTSEGPLNCGTLNDLDRIELRFAEVLLNKAEALVELGRNNEALPVINRIRERAFHDSEHNLASVTLDDIKQEWKLEFTYEQKTWYNNVRWKTLIKDINEAKSIEYYDDSYAVAGERGRNGMVVNQFFAKVYKHLHAKVNNVSVRNYRFPIPTDTEGGDLGIYPQNPGY